MKFCRKALLILILLFGFAVVCAPKAAAADLTLSLEYHAADTQNGSVVGTQSVDDQSWMFLPSSADKSALAFYFDNEKVKTITVSTKYGSVNILSGVEADFSAVFPGDDGIYYAEISAENVKYQLNIAFSANIRSMYITSADIEKQGRDWIEKDKENKAKGNGLVLLTAEGETVFDNTMKNMKGRGNSTWSYAKKPYQIKLKKAADLLENNESADTWVLLANTCDGTMMRNSITYSLANKLGFEYTPNSEYVDLYYDGEYRGTYLLCEKTEIGENRIEIANLEEAIADANTEDVETLDTAIGKNSYGNKFQYVKGAVSPEDISGGYLLEMDYAERATEEVSWFTLNDGEYVVIKSPEFATYEAVKYISEYFQGFVNAVDNGGTDPYTGKKISDYVDFDSLVRFIVIQEFTKNGDSFGSSTYFYKDAGDSIMYAGPIWDFDSCYGGFIVSQLQKAEGSMFGLDSIYRESNLGTRLLKIPEIRAAVREYYYGSFAPAVRSITLGNADTEGSIRYYEKELSASQEMNLVLWPEHMFGGKVAAWNVEGYDEYVIWLVNYVWARMSWFDGVMSTITVAPCTEIEIRADIDTGCVDLVDEYKACAEITDCSITENGDGSRTLEFIINKKDGISFDDNLIISVNGGECDYEIAESGEIKAFITFERTVDKNIPFTDVDKNSWYYNAIASVYENGIFNGVAEDRFDLNTSFSRAMLVSILWRMEGQPQAGENPFDDVTSDMWFASAAAWAYENGIVYGMGNNTFAGNNAITREQLMCVLARYAEYKGVSVAASGNAANEVSNWAADSVGWAVENGLFDFAGSGYLNAKAYVSRAQVAWIIIRFMSVIK